MHGAIIDPGDDTVTQWIVHWGDGRTNTFSSGGDKSHVYADDVVVLFDDFESNASPSWVEHFNGCDSRQ